MKNKLKSFRSRQTMIGLMRQMLLIKNKRRKKQRTKRSYLPHPKRKEGIPLGKVI